MEGLSFPDAGFTGLISFHVTLLDDSNEVVGGRAERVTVGLRSWEGWALLARKAPDFPTTPRSLSRNSEVKCCVLRATGFQNHQGQCCVPSAPALQDFSESPIFTDSVVFRVAPWIMTPSTLPPLEVYVCR